MKRRLSAVDARRRLGEVLEGVHYRGDEVIIERAGKPMAVVIPADRYQALEASRERLLELIEMSHERNRNVPLETIEADVAAAIAEVRSARRTATKA